MIYIYIIAVTITTINIVCDFITIRLQLRYKLVPYIIFILIIVILYYFIHWRRPWCSRNVCIFNYMFALNCNGFIWL